MTPDEFITKVTIRTIDSWMAKGLYLSEKLVALYVFAELRSAKAYRRKTNEKLSGSTNLASKVGLATSLDKRRM
jgi:hypothetical protein